MAQHPNKRRNGGIAQPQTQQPQAPQVQISQEVYQGPIPHPDVLKKFDEVIPGAAERILAMAENEAKHRHHQEALALAANIKAQEASSDLAEKHSKWILRSDIVGQVAGTIVSLAAIGGVIYLSSIDKTGAALALAALPTGALIRAFIVDRQKANPNSENPGKK